VSATRIDGKAVAAKVRAEVAAGVSELAARGVTPCLAVVLVGEDPASAVYVRNKGKAARECGVRVIDEQHPHTIDQAALLAIVQRLADDPTVDGILVQLPLPAHLDASAILGAVPPEKDVDGFHEANVGLLSMGRPRFVSCTPAGCMRLLAETGAPLRGARAIVVGRSNIVGKPMAMLLTAADATVTVAHSRTRDLAGEIARADVVVAALGKPEAIKGAWIKEGAVVIDVGINRLPDGRLVGDVEFEAAAARASAITPVPGGVGPMTIAMLLSNTLDAARRRAARA
jgi:methylenetetrahydrofolate dehydrogenase (NADP+)/methenyltetrahydrofolate cyclohydrolase